MGNILKALHVPNYLGNFYPPSSNCESKKTMFCYSKSSFLSSRTIQMEGCGECDLLDLILVLTFSSCEAFHMSFFFFSFFNASICTDEVEQSQEKFELYCLLV